MKLTTQHNQENKELKGLNRFFQQAMAPTMMVALVCACATQPTPETKSAKTNSIIIKSVETQLNYEQYLEQGKSALNGGNPTQAIENFKQSLRKAGNEQGLLQEAYGNLGLAYVAVSDNPKAQVYLEKAGAKEQAPTWIKNAYKNLLSSQTFMTTEYMDKKLRAEIEIEQEQAQWLATDQGTLVERTDTDDERRGFFIPKQTSTVAMLDKETHRPIPAETKPKSNTQASKRPKHPGPTALGSTHSGIQSNEKSLDIRIIFAVNSAELTPEGQIQADELGKLLQQELQNSYQIAVLVGHSDIKGSDAYDDHLSERRAAAVKSYLVSKFPGLKDKLSERGMGKRQLLFKEADEESQTLNRRVEVKLSRSAE